DISGLLANHTYTVGFGVTVTKNADGSVTFHGIQEGDHYGITTATNFNAIVVHDDVGSFDLGVFSLTQTNAGNPINLSYDLQIQDADGDTVALPGAINIELDPTAQQASVINNTVTTNSVITSSTSTSGLISGNDNGPLGQHRGFAVGQNAAVMAALAAAGLEAEHGKLDFHQLAGGSHTQTMTPLVAASAGAASFGSASTVSPTHIVQTTVSSNSVEGHQVASHFHETLEQAHGFNHAETHSAALTSLLNGTAPGAHGPVAHATPIMASGVAMPSAQQLAAALAGHGPAQGADHQVVSQVLTDALHGGEGHHGPSIDTLLNGPASHATHDVIEALASHAGSAVSFGHMGLAGGFHGTHNMFSMNGMAHHDAAPHHG
ncbi:MAG TPA: hypothetical protein VGQ34_04605, partial [Sphingomicrobium sp.]|nr:hypothetical protein [Sphingomicrobium sp.]